MDSAYEPIAVDLYCGLGGWAEGFLAEKYTVIGFDIEKHDYGTGSYPGWLVLQDVLTIIGAQFKPIADRIRVIVASPPCQEPSYRAMPWKRAKALNAIGPPHKFINLFNACFRIRQELEQVAGRKIPLIVENVRGAQPWVGRSAWNFGSYHLWGDVPALMPIPWRAEKFNPDGTNHPSGSWFAVADSKNRGARKVPGLDWSKHGTPGYKAQGFNITAAQRYRDGVKNDGSGWRENGSLVSSQRMVPDHRKCGGSWFGKGNDCSLMRQHSSKSNSRKTASAQIAKIPFPLARHIARSFLP